MTLKPGKVITEDSLVIYGATTQSEQNIGIQLVLAGQMSLDEYLGEVESRILHETLRRSGGHKDKAAEMVGLNFRQFRYRLTKTGEKDEEDGSGPDAE